jgi:uncharacterized repeat protein (TIGR03803 family)
MLKFTISAACSSPTRLLLTKSRDRRVDSVRKEAVHRRAIHLAQIPRTEELMKHLGMVRIPRIVRAYALLVVAAAILAGAAARLDAQPDSAGLPSVTPLPVNSAIYSFGDIGTDDGTVPKGSLTYDGVTLFGRTTTTVLNGGGVLFAINPDGTGYSILHRFAGAPDDGANPRHDAMTLINGVLYGTALQGGAHNGGVVFSIATDGTGYNILHDFRRRSGVKSHSCFVEYNGILYDMTANGGRHGGGVMFQIAPDGTGYQHNYNFNGASGSQPHGALALADGVFYGMTRKGGKHNLGVIFSIDPDGKHYRRLHDFKGGKHDGATTDHGYVTISGATMYGMTTMGGSANDGVVFSMGLDGTNFTILHTFGKKKHDGRNPYGSLMLNGTDLYGTTANGGAFGKGTVFHITTDGATYEVLHSFSGMPDGKKPIDNVILINGMLYGMTTKGGANNLGTIFAVPVAGD